MWTRSVSFAGTLLREGLPGSAGIFVTLSDGSDEQIVLQTPVVVALGHRVRSHWPTC